MSSFWYLGTRKTRCFFTAVYLVSGFFMFALQAATLDAPTLVVQEYNESFVTRASFDKGKLILGERGIHAYLVKNMRDISPAKAAKLTKLIATLSRKFKLAPGLILSVIRVESNFQPWAVSTQGALGLMQIMPETGRWLAARCGMKWEGPAMLLDESVNTTLGVTYLAFLRDRYNGDLKKMLSAYNRGPAAVDDDLAEGRSPTLAYYHKIRQFLPRFL